MAYSKTDFDAQIAAFIAAVAIDDIKAAGRALTNAEAIHLSLCMNVKIGDSGSNLERRAALDGLARRLDEQRERIAAVSGTADELLISRPSEFGTTSIRD